MIEQESQSKNDDNEVLRRQYIDQIAEHFPNVAIGEPRLLSHGWDHDVIIANNDTVFRFPKREEYKENFKRELELLRYLRNEIQVVLSVPDYIFVAPDQSFGGYKLLSGKEMRPEQFNGLSSEQKKGVAKQLGTFLTQLHSIPFSEVERLGFREEEGGHYWSKVDTEKRFEEIRDLVFPKLNQRETAWITKQFENYLALQFEYDEVLVHSDFTSDHILLDSEHQRISGVIDFADAEIGDPALDFTGLWEYGDSFVDDVAAHYGRPIDSDMLARSMHPVRFDGTATMLEIIQGKKVPRSWEEAQTMLRTSMTKYPN